MTNKLRYFIANWKMYGDLKSLKSIGTVINFVKSNKKKKFKLIYCPPYTIIHSFYNKIKKTHIKIGAQDCHQNNDNGAFTGSINAQMLKNLGVKFVIIGHSEKRKNGDNDTIINKKIKSALQNNLTVIFCIGETIQEKRKKLTKKILRSQIFKGLKNIKLNNRIIIAYEPIWSIGTGIIPKNFELIENVNFIKNLLVNKKSTKKVKVLYGGSVNTKNIDNLKKIHSLDGFLIGGASQNSKKLIDIVKKSFI